MKNLLKGKGKIGLTVLIVFLGIGCALLIPNININYDMTSYLPKDSNTLSGLEILEKEFGQSSLIQAMIEDVDVEDVIVLKNGLEGLPGVLEVLWLDDVIDLSIGIEFYPEEIVAPFYQDDKALITIIFEEDDHSLLMEEYVGNIREVLEGRTYSIRGNALGHIESRQVAEGEIFRVMILIVPICIVILLVASKSWFEPVVLLLVLGVGILFNMGTNALLGNVSFITMTMAMALQLAMSMDYSLFLMHRFHEEIESGLVPYQAAASAIKKAIPSITASALTTIAGFMALLIMRYSIGFDIGIVMSKGIIFSYLSVVLLMPVLMTWFAPLILKTKHKEWIPKFGPLVKIFHGTRWVIVSGLVLVAGASLFFSNKVSFLYGTETATSEESMIFQDTTRIGETFGPHQPIVLLIPNGEVSSEAELVDSLSTMTHVLKIEALVMLADPAIPREFLPEGFVRRFVGETHSRMVLYTDIEGEDDKTFEFTEELREKVSVFYETFYFVGMPTATEDIKNTVIEDAPLVMLLSIGAVFLVIAIVFRNLVLPLLLIAVIQTSIWMNLSISFIQGTQTLYIGYLVVMALQLGATIDYAVLLSNRYIEHRKTEGKIEALRHALDKSIHPIIVSASILAVAGFAEWLASDIKAVQEIGLLIGRGALLSGFMVILCLPSLLLLFDKRIRRDSKEI